MALRNIKPKAKPPADDFKTTYFSSRTATQLGLFALELPKAHPIRVTITNLLVRWAKEGEPPKFLRQPDGPVLTREHAIAMIREDQSAADFVMNVCDVLGITDADVSGDTTAALMAEAA